MPNSNEWCDFLKPTVSFKQVYKPFYFILLSSERLELCKTVICHFHFFPVASSQGSWKDLNPLSSRCFAQSKIPHGKLVDVVPMTLFYKICSALMSTIMSVIYCNKMIIMC